MLILDTFEHERNVRGKHTKLSSEVPKKKCKETEFNFESQMKQKTYNKKTSQTKKSHGSCVNEIFFKNWSFLNESLRNNIARAHKYT